MTLKTYDSKIRRETCLALHSNGLVVEPSGCAALAATLAGKVNKTSCLCAIQCAMCNLINVINSLLQNVLSTQFVP